jgi:hypothetical protein
MRMIGKGLMSSSCAAAGCCGKTPKGGTELAGTGAGRPGAGAAEGASTASGLRTVRTSASFLVTRISAIRCPEVGYMCWTIVPVASKTPSFSKSHATASLGVRPVAVNAAGWPATGTAGVTVKS